MPTGPGYPVASRPHHRRASAEERKRRGSTAQVGHGTGVGCSASWRDDDDEAVTARMVPFVERRYVFIGNGVFVRETNVGNRRQVVGRCGHRLMLLQMLWNGWWPVRLRMRSGSVVVRSLVSVIPPMRWVSVMRTKSRSPTRLVR